MTSVYLACIKSFVSIIIVVGGEPVEEIDTPSESQGEESKPVTKGTSPRKRKGKKVRVSYFMDLCICCYLYRCFTG